MKDRKTTIANAEVTKTEQYAQVEVITHDDGCVVVEVIDTKTGMRQSIAYIRPAAARDAHREGGLHKDDHFGVTVQTPTHAFAEEKRNLL